MSLKKILIAEDDQHISKLVKYNLEKAGFECIAKTTGEEAIDYLRKQTVDLIVLDIMLPEMDGFEACKLIKRNKSTSSIPVIFLTAKGEEVDRIVGFELGVDDYIVKPFSPRELVLRIKAILRRNVSEESQLDVFKVDDLVLDIDRHKLKVKGKEVKLTSMEFKLLHLLIERQGRVQSRDRLLDDVWDLGSDITTRTVDTHVKRLRKKLGKLGSMIETIRGVGYRFIDDEE